MKQISVSLSAVLLLASLAPAQEQPLKIDLARYYFASPAAEEKARAELFSAITELQKLTSNLQTGAQLLAALRANDRVQEVAYRHDTYLYLRCSLDRHDPACEQDDSLDNEVAARTAFFKRAIIAVPEAQLAKFYAAEPALAQYHFALEDMRRESGHELPAQQQELLARFSPEIEGWQDPLYDEIVSQIQFGKVQSAKGPLDVMHQRTLIAASPDPKIRQEGFQKRFAGYASQRDLLAFDLIHTVQAQQKLAQAQGYADAPARKYTTLYFTPDDTRAFLERMAANGDVPKLFEQIRCAEIERESHQPCHESDMTAPPQTTLPRLTFAQTRTILHETFAALGPEYQAAFDALINPASGRADVLPGGAPDRHSSGFSVGFPGTTSALFLGNFNGTFKDLSVIAHEGGHAVHRALMAQSGVLPDYAEGPHYLFESFAEFNELLLAEYLAKHSDDPALARYYREQWMYIKGLDSFDGAKDALLEQEIYDGVAKGTVKNADDLDRLTIANDRRFSIFPAQDPELRTRWAMISLAYEDPLYDVNYAYGSLLAVKYFQLYSKDPKEFAPRYLALLKNGFDAPPAELLKKFLGIDITSPALLGDVRGVLTQRLNELAHAKTVPAPPPAH